MLLARSRRTLSKSSIEHAITPASSSAFAATKNRRAPRNATSLRATKTWNGTGGPAAGILGPVQDGFLKGTHIRIHPLLHWTELNIWEYIEREGIPVIPLYFDNGKASAIVALAARRARCRVASTARTVSQIVEGAQKPENGRAIRPRSGPGVGGRVRKAPTGRVHVSQAHQIREYNRQSAGGRWTNSTGRRRSR